ncbi:MAG: acetyl-CoA C-acyltransferase [Polyangiales bacterium]
MDVFLVDALRTPRAKARESGGLHAYRPVELIDALAKELEARHGALAAQDLILGCATQTGDQGTNVARLAALWSGLGDEVPGLTLNRFCTSGLDAIGLAAGKLGLGDEVVLAGGVEMPSRVPMFADKGAWSRDAKVAERTRFVHMGVAADLLATEHGITREELDGYALRSQERAATDVGHPSRVAVGECEKDETARPSTSAASLASLGPAYAELEGPARDALHTIATSPALADGASLSLLANRGACAAKGWTPRARLRSYASVAVDPLRMLHGNPRASRLALDRAGLSVGDVDLWEVNESFAVVPLLFEREMNVRDGFNIHGGAIALGHPLGATGGVLTSTLVDALHREDKTFGVVSICGGAGVASALVWERV